MLSVVFQRFSPTTRGKWLQFRYFVITKKVWQRPIRRYLPSYPAEQISLKQTNSEVGNSCNKGKVSASCTSSVKGAVFSEESYRIFQSSVSPDRKKLEIAWNDGHKSIFDVVWLRHNCRCPSCHFSSGQKLVEGRDLPDGMTITSTTFSGQCMLRGRIRRFYSLVPRPIRKIGEKGLVSTVCACA